MKQLFPLLIFAAFVLVNVIGGLLRAAKQREQNRRQPAEPDEERRTHEIQEQIRRKIAERRAAAGQAPAEPPQAESVRPGEIEWDARQRQLREEMLRQGQARAETMKEPPPLPVPLPAASVTIDAGNVFADTQAAELRQAQAVLEAARKATAKWTAFTEPDAPSRAAGLRGGLREPANLRRAVVLREMLDPPLALR
jgi:hypothetical protein